MRWSISSSLQILRESPSKFSPTGMAMPPSIAMLRKASKKHTPVKIHSGGWRRRKASSKRKTERN